MSSKKLELTREEFREIVNDFKTVINFYCGMKRSIKRPIYVRGMKLYAEISKNMFTKNLKIYKIKNEEKLKQSCMNLSIEADYIVDIESYANRNECINSVNTEELRSRIRKVLNIKIKKPIKPDKKYISELGVDKVNIEYKYIENRRGTIVCFHRGHNLKRTLRKGDVVETVKGTRYVVVKQVIINKNVVLDWNSKDGYYILVKDKKVRPGDTIKERDLVHILDYKIIDQCWDALFPCNRIYCRKKKFKIAKINGKPLTEDDIKTDYNF
jgi:hypothetical protein